jgi:ATP-dependent phosphoenolpyruvate carboxykinase
MMKKAQQLAAKFISNFKDFEELVSPEIRAAAPRLA